MSSKSKEFFKKLDQLFKEYGVTSFGSCGCCDGTVIEVDNKYCSYLDLEEVEKLAKEDEE